jgi:hypothetical protein
MLFILFAIAYSRAGEHHMTAMRHSCKSPYSDVHIALVGNDLNSGIDGHLEPRPLHLEVHIVGTELGKVLVRHQAIYLCTHKAAG